MSDKWDDPVTLPTVLDDYKVRQELLQSGVRFITKWRKSYYKVEQELIQRGARVITKFSLLRRDFVSSGINKGQR